MATASAAFRPPRATAATDDLYLLSLGAFFGPGDLTVESVRTAGETLELGYVVHHPFPAPTDLDAPATAGNRADLGFAGMVLLLADVAGPAGNSYFNSGPAERVIANTRLLTNADAYYRPAGLLALSSVAANTFPYKLVVDELLDSRTSQRTGAALSNGGPTGNYDPAVGWQRFNMMGGNDGWTGYGVLHQGQSARNTLALSLAELGTGGPVALDLVVIAKYTDPRGGSTRAEQRANRLPPTDPDTARFVYREPHGALDIQRVIYAGESGGFLPGAASSSTLAFHLEDWDARALPTGQADLANEPMASLVAQGENGFPDLAVSIPGVLDTGNGSGIEPWDPTTDLSDDDSAYGGDAAADSGIPGDPLFYRRTVSKPAADGGTAGAYTGMVRVVDVEAALADPNFTIELDPSLAPLASNHPKPEAYQAFAVTLQGGTSCGCGWAVRYGGGGDDEGRDLALDADGNILVTGFFSGVMSFGGPTRTALGDGDIFLLKLDPEGDYLWDLTWGSVLQDEGEAIAVDPNGDIWIAGSYGSGINFGGGVRPHAGESDLFLLKLNTSGSYLLDRTYGSVSFDLARDLAVSNNGGIAFAGAHFETIDFGGGPRSPDSNQDGFLLRLTAAAAYAWDVTFGAAGSPFNYGNGVAFDDQRNVYLAGNFTGPQDFGGGVRNSTGFSDALVVKYTEGGTWLWDRHWGIDEFAVDSTFAVHVLPTSNDPVAAGMFSGSIDLGGGVRTAQANFASFVTRYTAGGTYVWDRTWSGTGTTDTAWMLASDASDAVFVGGRHSQNADFGGGPRPVLANGNAFLVKFTAGGIYQWDDTWTMAGAGIAAVGLVTDPAGDPLFAGGFDNTMDFEPGPGATTLMSLGSDDVFVAKVRSDTGGW
ncbi:MAG TPA: hypothetical protein VEI97_00355 [bacterium]|nr:hypothetical protein [bacterium]